MGLSEQQRKVLEHTLGHLLVLAGPGSGKTHTVIEKIFSIFENKIIPEPYGMLVVTFSNAAVGEIRTRLRQRNFPFRERVTVQTFHGFANYLLRCYGSDVEVREDFEIIADTDQRTILTKIIEKHSSQMRLRDFRKYIDDFKRQGIYPHDNEKFQLPGEKRFQAAFAEYQEHLSKHNQLDFTDLIHFAIQLLQNSVLAHDLFTRYFQYVIVDEFQDTDSQQLELIRILAKNAIGSTIVADDDQAIYSFRGGDKANVEKIQKWLQAELYALPENFRSPEVIVEAAQALIRQESNRLDKDAVIVRDERGLLYTSSFASDQEEASQVVEWISALEKNSKPLDLEQIAIIGRNRNRLKTLEEELKKSSIPYFDRSQLPFEDTWDTHIALALMSLACDPRSSNALYLLMSEVDNAGIPYYLNKEDALDVACQMREKIEKISTRSSSPEYVWLVLETSGFIEIIDRIVNATGEKNRIIQNLKAVESTIQAKVAETGTDLNNVIQVLLGKDAIQFITSHGSKGREFDYVFFVGVEDDVIPGWGNLSESDISEARSVFYVTLTRVRKELYITYADKISGYSKKPSRFIYDIPKEYFTKLD